MLDLIDLLPEQKKNLPYHFFGDNFFSSQKLVDVLSQEKYEYTGTIRKDRVKGSPPLTSVELFKKKARGHHETVVLEDRSQIITRWNDNAPVTMISSILGDLPLATTSRYSRTAKKYIDVTQPDVVRVYNQNMGGVDRFDQNQNHTRITIGGKKWYWSIITWLIDAAVQNAWQLHRKAGGSLSLLDFKREYVCVALRDAGDTRSRNSSGTVGRLSRFGDDEIRFDGLHHYVIVKKDERKRCAYEGCSAKCQSYCNKCQRALCLYHFMPYHIQ